MVNTEGLSKAAVLAALYNNARTQGAASLNYKPDHIMTEEEAQEIIDDWGDKLYFDYLYGRVLKVDLSYGSGFDEWLYDRDNGVGRAQRVIDKLRDLDFEGRESYCRDITRSQTPKEQDAKCIPDDFQPDPPSDIFEETFKFDFKNPFKKKEETNNNIINCPLIEGATCLGSGAYCYSHSRRECQIIRASFKAGQIKDRPPKAYLSGSAVENWKTILDIQGKVNDSAKRLRGGKSKARGIINLSFREVEILETIMEYYRILYVVDNNDEISKLTREGANKEMSNNKKYAWTLRMDDDIWRGGPCDSIDECVKEAISEGYKNGDSISVGLCEDYKVDYVDGDYMVEWLQEQAIDKVGEVAYDWLDSLTSEQRNDLGNMLLETVNKWMKKHDQEPHFYKVQPLYNITIGEDIPKEK